VLAQAADADIATATRAVLWNADLLPDRSTNSMASRLLAALIESPIAELGSASPELDASLSAHAVLGRMTDNLTAMAGDALRRGGGPGEVRRDRPDY
jgi:hypothetical protein